MRNLGSVHLLKENGRPENVYALRASANVRHDTLLTECLIRYPEATIERDPDEPPYPDAVMNWKQTWWWELDTGEETGRQLRKKFDAYRKADIEGWMLFCTISERRLKNVQQYAIDFMLLSTVQRVIDDPHGKIWEDADGTLFKL